MKNLIKNIEKETENKTRSIFNSYIKYNTNKFQDIYGFEIGTGEHASWNNEADAFKHAYMQWSIAYYMDQDIAKKYGDMHENETPNAPAGERNMDLWNNAIGREIAYEMKRDGEHGKWIPGSFAGDIAAEKIMEKMRAGELITVPSDPRKFENMELERLTPQDRYFYSEEYNQTFDEKLKDIIMDGVLKQAINNNWKVDNKASVDAKVKSGELIYVSEYTKADGTKISGYYRRKPTH